MENPKPGPSDVYRDGSDVRIYWSRAEPIAGWEVRRLEPSDLDPDKWSAEPIVTARIVRLKDAWDGLVVIWLGWSFGVISALHLGNSVWLLGSAVLLPFNLALTAWAFRSDIRRLLQRRRNEPASSE